MLWSLWSPTLLLYSIVLKSPGVSPKTIVSQMSMCVNSFLMMMCGGYRHCPFPTDPLLSGLVLLMVSLLSCAGRFPGGHPGPPFCLRSHPLSKSPES